MPQIFIRAITTSFSTAAEVQVKSAIGELLNDAGIQDITFSPITPYWKNPEQGELGCQFSAHIPLGNIQQLFADTWQADTADIRRSTIHLPHISFLWITS